jgi:hypothetical protein
MSLFKKLAVLGAAAEAARRYARSNPEKAREFTEKAAKFADHQTKGRYSAHINQAKSTLANVGGFAESPDRVVAEAEVIEPVYPAAPRPTPYKRG